MILKRYFFRTHVASKKQVSKDTVSCQNTTLHDDEYKHSKIEDVDSPSFFEY